ncbi:hypothetical protein H8356DRAFT_1710595 [Neocallimastix lanati (nom. inval.)]|nr:hypothetical protein H8356DRAFT_1710595 [Neocallimastix sp. JGI-2020a]
MYECKINRVIISLNSYNKIEYEYCKDAIFNTFTCIPTSKFKDECVTNFSGLLDSYFSEGGFHLNVIILVHETLKDVMINPELCPNLTILFVLQNMKFISFV